MKQAAFFSLVSSLVLTGCWPWWTLRRPEISFVVRDMGEKPISGAKILVVVVAMPHGVFQGGTTVETNQDGLASVDAERRWELLAFTVHGIREYFVIWCAEAVGFAAAKGELTSENNGQVEIRLQKSGMPTKCSEVNHFFGQLSPTDHFQP